MLSSKQLSGTDKRNQNSNSTSKHSLDKQRGSRLKVHPPANQRSRQNAGGISGLGGFAEEQSRSQANIRASVQPMGAEDGEGQMRGNIADTGLAPSPSAEVIVQSNKKGRQGAVLTSKGMKQQRQQSPRKNNLISNKDIKFKPMYTDEKNGQQYRQVPGDYSNQIPLGANNDSNGYTNQMHPNMQYQDNQNQNGAPIHYEVNEANMFTPVAKQEGNQRYSEVPLKEGGTRSPTNEFGGEGMFEGQEHNAGGLMIKGSTPQANSMLNHDFIGRCNDRVAALIQNNEYQDAIDMLLKCEQALDEEKSHEQYLSDEKSSNQNVIHEGSDSPGDEGMGGDSMPIVEALEQCRLLFRTYSNLQICYNQVMQHALSYDYLMRSLDAALKYMDISKKQKQTGADFDAFDETSGPITDQTFSSNQWIERGIAETLFKITMVYFNQRNFTEAKKYANYSVQSCKNCVQHIKDKIENKNGPGARRMLSQENYMEFQEMNKGYFELIELYLMVLKTSGQVYDRLNQFDEANKQYNLAKILLLANFITMLPQQYDFTYKEHQYEYDLHRNFVERNKLEPHPQLLLGYQKLQKDLNKLISASNLKTKYLNQEELYIMTRQNQNRSDALLKKTISANYIQQYVNKLQAQQAQSVDGFGHQSMVGDRLSEYLQKSSPSKIADFNPLGQAYRQSGSNLRGIKEQMKRSQVFERHNNFDASSPLDKNHQILGNYSPHRNSLGGAVKYNSNYQPPPGQHVRTSTSGQALPVAVKAFQPPRSITVKKQRVNQSEMGSYQQKPAYQSGASESGDRGQYGLTGFTTGADTQSFNFGKSKKAAKDKLGALKSPVPKPLVQRNRSPPKLNQNLTQSIDSGFTGMQTQHTANTKKSHQQQPPAGTQNAEDKTRFSSIERDKIVSEESQASRGGALKRGALGNSRVRFAPQNIYGNPAAAQAQGYGYNNGYPSVQPTTSYNKFAKKAAGPMVAFRQRQFGQLQRDSYNLAVLSSADELVSPSARGANHGIRTYQSEIRRRRKKSKSKSMKRSRSIPKFSNFNYQMRMLMKTRANADEIVQNQLDRLESVRNDIYEKKDIMPGDTWKNNVQEFEKERGKWQEELCKLKSQIDMLKSEQERLMKEHKDQMMTHLIEAQNILQMKQNDLQEPDTQNIEEHQESKDELLANTLNIASVEEQRHREAQQKEQELLQGFAELKEQQDQLMKVVERSRLQFQRMDTQLSFENQLYRRSVDSSIKMQESAMLPALDKTAGTNSTVNAEIDVGNYERELLKEQWKINQQTETLEQMKVECDTINDQSLLRLRVYFSIIGKRHDAHVPGSQQLIEKKTDILFGARTKFLRLCKQYLPQIGFERQPYQGHIDCVEMIISHLMEEVAATERAESEKRRILEGIQQDLKGLHQANREEDAQSTSQNSQVSKGILNRSLDQDSELEVDEELLKEIAREKRQKELAAESKANAEKMINQFYAIAMVKACLKRYMLAKEKHLENVKSKMDKRYMELAEETQALRSESSRANDPVLPDGIQKAKLVTARSGMYLSMVNRGYIFMYKIHEHAMPKDEDAKSGKGAKVDGAEIEEKKYSWSLYVRFGRRTNVIWQFHKFSPDVLKETLGLANSLTSGDDPIDLLNGFVLNICKATTDFVLEDAEENKHEFASEAPEKKTRSLNNVEIDDPSNKKGDEQIDSKVVLNKEQKASWENMWMDNLRQQIHLEL